MPNFAKSLKEDLNNPLLRIGGFLIPVNEVEFVKYYRTVPSPWSPQYRLEVYIKSNIPNDYRIFTLTENELLELESSYAWSFLYVAEIKEDGKLRRPKMNKTEQSLANPGIDFERGDLIAYLEIALLALDHADKWPYGYIASSIPEKLDISETEVKRLRDQINDYMNESTPNQPILDIGGYIIPVERILYVRYYSYGAEAGFSQTRLQIFLKDDKMITVEINTNELDDLKKRLARGYVPYSKTWMET